MSDGNDISFVINYNGKFENIEGEVLYVGGSTHLLETAPQALFIGLKSADIVDLYGQRIWYKLPYEELKELKILCDGGSNFESMCRAASWSRVIEVFMEHDDVNDGQNDAYRRNGGDGHNDGDGQSDGDEHNDGDGKNDGAATNPPYFHEAERVEEIVAGFVDEEEEVNEAYRNTPSQSDSEEDQNEIPYDRWRRGSGELKIMLLFDSVKEFRKAVLEYALKGGWNIKFTRWGSEKSEAKCAVKSDHPCHWRIYCSFEESIGYWMVKTFQEEHSCTKDSYCKLLTDAVITNMFLHDIRKEPKLMPKAIQDTIQERYNLTVTHDICRKARKKALEDQPRI